MFSDSSYKTTDTLVVLDGKLLSWSWCSSDLLNLAPWHVRRACMHARYCACDIVHTCTYTNIDCECEHIAVFFIATPLACMRDFCRLKLNRYSDQLLESCQQHSMALAPRACTLVLIYRDALLPYIHTRRFRD